MASWRHDISDAGTDSTGLYITQRGIFLSAMARRLANPTLGRPRLVWGLTPEAKEEADLALGRTLGEGGAADGVFHP